jgi:protoheme IX farnesyltransferase
MVALSALAGYLFAGGRWQLHMLLVTAGVGLLAAGSSALNQWQEQDLDQLMERTRLRPLPTGRMMPQTALLLAALCISGGSLLLAALPGSQALLLGLLAVVWYNAIYTSLKRVTPFAAIPGAVCGALPPLIGWTAAGGMLLTQKSLILAGTLFIWQIPHTWLLLCRYRDDLRNSGLPNLFETLSTGRLLKINNSWLMSLLVCYLFFPLFNYIKTPALSILFITGLFVLFYSILKTVFINQQTVTARKAFHLVNTSMLLLLTVLIVDNLLY